MLSEIDRSGNSIKDYVYAEDELIAWVEQTGDTTSGETQEQVFYPLNDHLGTPFYSIRGDVQLGSER